MLQISTNSAQQFNLCGGCSHRIFILQQQPNSSLILKIEEDDKSNFSSNSSNSIENCNENETNLSSNSLMKKCYNDFITPSDYSSQINYSENNNFLETTDHNYQEHAFDKESVQPTSSQDADVNILNSKNESNYVIFDNRFPESDFDLLEKRLLSIESELVENNQQQDSAAFKRLCSLAVNCEDRWVQLFINSTNIFGKTYTRLEALNFLQYNLRIRRFGLRPTLKFAELAKQTQNYQELRTSKKIYTKNKSPVSIKIFHHNLLNISNENELEKLPKLNSSLKEPKVTQTSMNIAKGNVPSAVPWAVSKRSYGSCVSISNLIESPHCSSNLQDPCFQLENQLFDIECRLKKHIDNGTPFNNSEYKLLLLKGQNIREEWKKKNEYSKRFKSHNFQGYDLQKCVVISRDSKLQKKLPF